MANVVKRSYKIEKSLEERRVESSRMYKKYRNKICIIVEKGNNTYIKDIDRRKYLVPEDMTMGGLNLVIRKRLELDSKDSLIFFVNGKHLFPITTPLSTIYNLHGDEDGFLYISYTNENTFG